MSEQSYRPSSRTAEQGFTLIELMVTIGVAGILLTLAAPVFTRLVAKTDATQTSNELVGALHLARSEAASRGVTVAVAASSGGWVDGWSVEIPAAAGSASAVPEVLRVHGALPSAFTITTVPAAVATVAYSPRGSVESAVGPTDIHVCHDVGDQPQGTVITVRGAGTLSSHRDASLTGADC